MDDIMKMELEQQATYIYSFSTVIVLHSIYKVHWIHCIELEIHRSVRFKQLQEFLK